MIKFGKFWKDKNGGLHRHPNYETALKHGLKLYEASKPCVNCGGNIRYVKNNRCKHCAMDVAIIFNNVVNHHCDIEEWVKLDTETGNYIHNARVGSWLVMDPDMYCELLDSIKVFHAQPVTPKVRIEPCQNGHVGMFKGVSTCLVCEIERSKQVSPRKAAVEAGEAWYTPATPCKHCGEIAPKRVSNGSCRSCEEKRKKSVKPKRKSPRQAAIEAGETWYTPTTPCKYCGEIAPKRVSNGSCRSCEEKRKKFAGAKRQSPRQAAIAAGEAWYMPTTPCKMCGEIAPKRVNNGSCRSCEEKRKQCGNPQ